MTLLRPLHLAGAALATAGLSLAQSPHFNEIYGSMEGTDDYEYIELVGTPNASLDDYYVVILEGDSVPAGILDRLWDLNGYSMDANGRFLMADLAVPGMQYNLFQGPHAASHTLGDAHHIENGTNTFYLIYTTDAAAASDLLTYYNTDTDADDDGITDIATDPRFTIVDIVGITDGSDPTDTIMDGAVELGPDGPFLPAGVLRDGDFPNGWCSDVFLDFCPPNHGCTPSSANHTPGAPNPVTGCTQAMGGNTGGPVGISYCGPALNNSTGSPATISGFGSNVATDNDLTLTANGLPQNQFGYFIGGKTPAFVVFPGGSQGVLCLTGAIARFNNQIGNSGAGGSISAIVNTTSVPLPPTLNATILAGETWYFQAWYRDLNPGATSNFTDGLEVLFQ